MGRQTGPETGSDQTDLGSVHDGERDVRHVSRPVQAGIGTQKAMAATQRGFTGATVTDQQLRASYAGTAGPEVLLPPGLSLTTSCHSVSCIPILGRKETEPSKHF